MKKFKILFMSLMVVSFFSACDKSENTATPSSTTFLPKMAMKGESSIVVPCGESFTDPGITVTESGKPIENSVAISGAYFSGTEVSGPDEYTIAYSAVNKDGIPGSAFRTVLVMPCNQGGNDLSGLYSMDVVRSSNGEAYAGLTNAFIVKTGDDTYAISDCIGGFYDLGRGYGSNYACKGSIITYDGTTASASDGTVPGFGFSTEILDLVIGSDGVISYTARASFTDWAVTMTPQ